MYVCSFPSKYEHQPKTFVSNGPPKGIDPCDEDCPSCDDYGFLKCSHRGRCRFGFMSYRKTRDIEQQMKREGRCLDCGAVRWDP